MRTALLILITACVLAVPTAAQEVTGLDGWSIVLDPGHFQEGNQGFAGYSEAHKTLRVGRALEDLLDETDIDSVYMTRTNDFVEVSLTQRVDYANSVGAAHFHSIHSNAAGPTANHLFILWAQYRDGSEAVPNGGKHMSELMAPPLAGAMRIPMAYGDGDVGECDFYGASSCRTRDTGYGKGGSRNFVQSFTAMASELSEAGFHTNPTQNQRNMNADWKRLEAQAMFWGILEYHDAERPPVHIATGIIRDIETGLPLNGATVTIGDTSYTTDTYQSLFHQYSNDPEQLRNGFYYLDGLQAGALPVTVEAEGYETFTGNISVVDTFFTFLDVELLSNVPPVVASTVPAASDTMKIIDEIVINFSRIMDTASVRQAFTLQVADSPAPPVEGDFQWTNDRFRLIFDPDSSLNPLETYTLTIEGDAEGFYGDPLDGNGDGDGGDQYTLTFHTGPLDAFPPEIVATNPTPGYMNTPLRPVISIAFDEALDGASVDSNMFHVSTTAAGEETTISTEHYVVNERSVINVFAQGPLAPETYYRLDIDPGLQDVVGNTIEEQNGFVFRTAATEFSVTTLDDFEDAITTYWWQPQQSGTLAGIVTDSTEMSADAAVVNLLTGSTQSMRLDYGWDTSAGNWIIREYLGGGEPLTKRFDAQDILQVYVFGDGLGNRFRFAVDELSTGQHEVSPWYTVDWIGWRLVSWDIDQSAGDWDGLGDGTIQGELRFDSFQLTYTPGNEPFGQFYFDDLRVAVETEPVAGEPRTALPDRIALHQNYPNPFGASTTLRFDLAAPSEVTLTVYDVLGKRVAVLARDATYAPGTHEITWQPPNLPSGVYFAQLQAGEALRAIKLVHVK